MATDDTKKPRRWDARVPLDWSSDVSRAQAKDCPKGTLGHTVLETGCAALDAIGETLSRVLDAKAAIHATAQPIVLGTSGPQPSGVVTNQRADTIQVTGHEAELDRSMMLAFNKLTPRVAGALDSMRKQKKTLEEKVANVFKEDASTRAFAHEIRNHFRDQKGIEKAIKMIQDAPEDEARQIAVALYRPGMPSFLSPAPAPQLARLRAAAEQRFAPSESAQLQTASRVIAQLEASRESFVRKFNSHRPKVKQGIKANDALAALAGVK